MTTEPMTREDLAIPAAVLEFNEAAISAAALRSAADLGPKEQPNGSFYTPDALLHVGPGQWREMSRATQLDVIAWLALDRKAFDRSYGPLIAQQRRKQTWVDLRLGEWRDHPGWLLPRIEELYGPIAHA